MFGKSSTKILIKSVVLTTIVVVSYFTGRALSAMVGMSDQFVSGMWCAVSAIVVFDDLRENVMTLLKNRLIGTFIGSLLAVLSIYFIHDIVISLCVSLVIVSTFINILNLSGALKIACTTVLIVTIPTHSAAFSEIWINALMRFIESALGCLMSLGATVVMDQSKYIKNNTEEGAS